MGERRERQVAKDRLENGEKEEKSKEKKGEEGMVNGCMKSRKDRKVK